jgi:hypothetical protein
MSSELNLKMKQIFKKYKSYMTNAKKRNISFNIEFMTFVDRITKPCYVCGYFHEDKLNGLDRINNSLGYNPLNVAACCWTCNRSKNNSSLSEFKEWLSRMGGVKDSFVEAEISSQYAQKGYMSRAEMVLHKHLIKKQLNPSTRYPVYSDLK